jgi:hypothetical protein
MLTLPLKRRSNSQISGAKFDRLQMITKQDDAEVVKCRSTTMCITAKARDGGRRTTHSTFFMGA